MLDNLQMDWIECIINSFKIRIEVQDSMDEENENEEQDEEEEMIGMMSK